MTAIDTSTAGVTVRPVDPLIEPEVAEIVALPTPAPVANPVPLIVATAVLDEPQLTELVRFCVLPSLYVPVAVNCCVVPLAIEGFAGVTAIDTNDALPAWYICWISAAERPRLYTRRSSIWPAFKNWLPARENT